jgi:HTH-type transcriptional regulator/antitoxin HigA
MLNTAKRNFKKEGGHMNKLIKTEAEHADALERLSALMDAHPAEGSKEADELELLGHLIEQYEQKAFPRSLPDPIEAIQFRMEQAGLKRKDLAPLLGGASRVSEVLSGKRALSPAMMRRLHADLDIPAEVLLQEPKASLPKEFPQEKLASA